MRATKIALVIISNNGKLLIDESTNSIPIFDYISFGRNMYIEKKNITCWEFIGEKDKDDSRYYGCDIFGDPLKPRLDVLELIKEKIGDIIREEPHDDYKDLCLSKIIKTSYGNMSVVDMRSCFLTGGGGGRKINESAIKSDRFKFKIIKKTDDFVLSSTKQLLINTSFFDYDEFDIIKFGKYKGKTVRQLMNDEKSWSYMSWAQREEIIKFRWHVVDDSFYTTARPDNSHGRGMDASNPYHTTYHPRH